jgi:hypothetical protein
LATLALVWLPIGKGGYASGIQDVGVAANYLKLFLPAGSGWFSRLLMGGKMLCY